MLKLVVFIPETDLEKVKKALFASGAGQDERYTHSCWQTAGQMQYIPRSKSEPAIGEKGELVTITEYRVEMICAEEKIDTVIQALHQAHPYEVPAYEIYQLNHTYHEKN